MPNRIDQREAIISVLKSFDGSNFSDASRQLFAALGYRSDRSVPIATPRQFHEHLDPNGCLTDRECEALDRLQSLHLLFQLTDSELGAQRSMFDEPGALQTTKIESYLFFAGELPAGHYTRTDLSTLVRAINKPLPMPAIVLFRHGDTVSIGIIHRRLHRRDQARDVLEKVTLIKDINLADPIRAHIEILNDFVLANLDGYFGVSNFVCLHEAWQQRLGSYALSNDFYREIADWYFWAHHQVVEGGIRLPLHCDTDQEKSLFLIRLLTRVIFCWFLIEKRLIPTDLFREHRLKMLLNDFSPSYDTQHLDTAPTYYRAILQNLFFGTLNMPSEQRAFREKKKDGQRYDKNYGITNLWRYQTVFRNAGEWVELAGHIPFLNGGLFDCLDDKPGNGQQNSIRDGFSDREDFGCHLPNDLFFGPERSVDLSRDYGEEEKRTARSKKAKVRGLIEILSRYKFTIEENTPLEEEIALDPELLGKVFENLLASYNEDTRTTARKALGAFYTPREIVSYMVDEALKSYLGNEVPQCKAALNDLFSDTATLMEIKPDTREALIAAIARVKILDPACGSGAYPMGALHRLVDLLRKLDADNTVWQALQRRRAIAETEEAFQSGDHVVREQRLREINDTFEFNTSDYGRKLYLIENCIYGVDIQPIATQIAKLRFFIALMVDQKVDTAVPDLGVRPLPNLETRLVAADTLVPLPKLRATQRMLFDDADSETYYRHISLKDELKRIRHEHFNAREPKMKRYWRDEDLRIREELREILKKIGLQADATKAMAAWDPYNQNASAPFFDSEWMFGLPIGKVRIQGAVSSTLIGDIAMTNASDTQEESGTITTQEIDSGFDIVIGNPPYIRIQTLKQKDPGIVAFYKEQYASAAKGNYDIYVVFIEAGLRLLKSDGHLAYICPHKFFNAQYGEPIREVISKGRHLRHVVYFGDQQVFPGATIYTCLLFLANGGSSDCRYVSADNLETWKARLDGVERLIRANAVGISEWNFSVGKGANIFDRLQAMPTKLSDVVSHISQGIRTSANEVYVLNVISEAGSNIRATSKKLGKLVDIERRSVRLFLQGREIKPYSILPSGKVVIIPYRLDGHTMELIPFDEITRDTPLLAKYLLENQKTLKAREGEKMDTSNWYGYVYPKNLCVMMEPKLLVPDIADRACFAIDTEGDYAFTSGYGITFQNPIEHPLKYMLALCNSRILDFYWRIVSTPFRGGFYRYFSQFIEQLPVADSTGQQRARVSILTDYIIYHNRNIVGNASNNTARDPFMLAYWEQVINALVYELYFPDEVHRAGLWLFDLVEQAEFPEIDTIPEPDRLKALRRKFEELYDGANPLRIALGKLQTLDTIRIIEGKA